MAALSGHKPYAVYQDFYVKLIGANIHQLMVNDCEEHLVEISKKSTFKRAVNNNVTIGIVRNKIPKLLSKAKNITLLIELKIVFLRYLEPVRPNRKYLRKTTKISNKGKYFTLTNYRRAS